MNLALLLSVLLGAAPADGAVVATVDGVQITARELQERIAVRKARGAQGGAESAAASLVDEILLAAEATRLKVPLPPELAAQVDEARRRLAGKRYLENMLEEVTPDEAALRDLFHLNADSVRFKLLVFTSQAAGQAARQRIEKGGSFQAEAKNSLHQESARQGGDMGLRNRGALPGPLAKVVFAAPLDQLYGPEPLDLGFALVQVSARTIGTEAEFQQRKSSIVGFAREQMRGATRKHLVGQLRAKGKVQLDEKFLESTGGTTDAAQGAKVIATVAGKPLTYGELIAYITDVFQGKPQGHAFGATVKIEMANALIDDLLLQAEALRLGVDKSPAVVAEVAPLRREALSTAMAMHLRDTAPAPTDAEVDAWYKAHLAEYRVAGSRRCRGIVVQTTADAARVVQRLEAGEAFPAVAKAVSIDPASAGKGGDLGEVSFDTLAAMERDPAQAPLARTIRSAPAGELAGPVSAGGAQYLFRCEAIRPERALPLAEVRPDVLTKLRAQAGQRALEATLARLRGAARITIDREAVLRAAPSPHAQ